MKNQEAISNYRTMWIMLFFDIPVETKKQQKSASLFRKQLLEDGFTMFQFSIYIRHCASRENCDVHLKRIKNRLPEYGHVGILRITDKQFEQMELFFRNKPTNLPTSGQQLELF